MDQPVGFELPWSPTPRPGRDELRGAHVTLRPIDPADAPALYAATRDDDSLWTYMGDGPYATAQAMHDALAIAAASEDPLYFAVVVDGQVLGRTSYMRITPAQGVIEIGNIVFATALQRTTAATEAIYLMARHAFDDLGYRRLEWKCNALNAPSRRAADRFGFTFEGVFRHHMIVKGRNRDTAWFAMLEAEWPARKAAFERWLDPANFDAQGRQKQSLRELNQTS